MIITHNSINEFIMSVILLSKFDVTLVCYYYVRAGLRSEKGYDSTTASWRKRKGVLI